VKFRITIDGQKLNNKTNRFKKIKELTQHMKDSINSPNVGKEAVT
jgi:hypothetical protein